MGTQGLALLMVIWFAVTHPEIILPPAHDYHAIELVPTPVPVPREPAPLKVIPAPRTVAQLPEPKHQIYCSCGNLTSIQGKASTGLCKLPFMEGEMGRRITRNHRSYSTS